MNGCYLYCCVYVYVYALRLKSFSAVVVVVVSIVFFSSSVPPIHYTATKLAVMVMVIVISFPTQIKDGLNKCLRHDRASIYAPTNTHIHTSLCVQWNIK